MSATGAHPATGSPTGGGWPTTAAGGVAGAVDDRDGGSGTEPGRCAAPPGSTGEVEGLVVADDVVEGGSVDGDDGDDDGAARFGGAAAGDGVTTGDGVRVGSAAGPDGSGAELGAVPGAWGAPACGPGVMVTLAYEPNTQITSTS